MIKTLIFDLNRVLVDDTFFYNDELLHDELLKTSLGIDSRTFLSSYKKFANDMGLGKLTEDSFWGLVLTDAKAKQDVCFCKKFIREIFYEIDGIKDLIFKLKSDGFELIILSGDSDYFTEYKVNNFGFDKLFDKVYSTAGLSLNKTNPKIYELLLKLIGRKADECLFIDDLNAHLLAAKKVGINVIIFKSVSDLVSNDFFIKVI